MKYSEVMKSRAFYAIVCSLWSVVAFAQVSAPKYSNEFLSIGVGARGLAMSNSQVSHIADGTSAYWNPAGLMEIRDKYEISLMHAAYFAGVANYDFVGFAMPIDSMNHIGISIIRFGVDDIPDTRFLYDANGALNYDNIRFFSAADYAFLFSFARKSTWLGGIKAGANFKIVHRSVGEFATAWGFGLDVGFQKHFTWMDFGLMLRDITGTFNAWSHNSSMVEDIYTLTGNIIPVSSLEVTLPRAILGASHPFKIGEKMELLASIDLEMTFDGKRNAPIKTDLLSIAPMAGMEFDFSKIAFLRLGAGKFQKVKGFNNTTLTSWQPNFGLGVSIKGLRIDYAMTDVTNSAEGLYSHVFSLALGLNDKKQL